jgi:hypothetical protein
VSSQRVGDGRLAAGGDRPVEIVDRLLDVEGLPDRLDGGAGGGLVEADAESKNWSCTTSRPAVRRPAASTSASRLTRVAMRRRPSGP